ncbi:MAG: hypothetical protein K2W85_01955 [Phycisphaerales bacterium]|nr:hypothetical protein [Phycisphaerales bacterium]
MALSKLNFNTDVAAAVKPFESKIDAAQKLVANAKTKKEGEKELTKLQGEQSKAVAKAIVTNMGLVKKASTELSLFLETQLSQAAGFLKSGQDAAKKGQLMVVQGCPGTIDVLLGLAKKASDDFGSAWMSYRAASKPAEVSASDYTGFTTIRTEVMNEGKIQVGKVEKIKSLLAQAQELLKTAEQAASQTGPDDALEQASQAKAVAENAADLASENIGKTTTSVTSISALKTHADLKKSPDKLVKLGESSYVNAKAFANEVKTLITTAEKTLSATKGRLKDVKDPKVLADLKGAEQAITTAKADFVKVMKNVNDAAKALSELQDKAKSLTKK